MSPWRTLQWRKPARSMRARASSSMSSDRSMPRPRSIRGPKISRMRPVPVPRSSSERNGDIEAGHQRAGKLRARAVFAEAEERPGAFPEALDQPGLDHELEVARDARLRLAQNLGQIGH